MKFRKFIPVLLAAVLVISACAAPQTEEPAPAAPEPTATAVPEPTQEPTEEPTPEPMDIVDTAVADGRFTTLVAAVEAAGLVDALKAEGQLTVFAPTDEAFAALPEGTVDALLNDISALTEVLLYHVVEGKVMAEDVVTLEQAQTLQGQYLDIKVDDGKVFLDGAEVIITDIETANGVIHVIDTVVQPETRDIVEVAAEDGRFTTLVAAVEAAGLVDALKAEGPLTVFAPTDEAFAALPEGTVDALLNDIPTLTEILTYHVVEGKVMAADVVELENALTLQGQNVGIRVEDGSVYIDDAQVIITDIETANGVIHVIDAVVQPETRDIVEVAAEDGRFTTLVAAVEAAGLVDALKAEGPLTVFAPTDDAFAALPEGSVDALLNDIPTLTEVLLYHVVDGKVMAEDVVDLGLVQTLQGQYLDINVDDGMVFLDGAEVIITDIETANGVIHVIDAVVQPEAGDIVDVAAEDGRFTTLVAAVEAAGLVDALKAEGPLTVFAPTDDAFAALPEGTVDALLNDIPTLTDILLYHVVDGKVMSTQVVELTEADTLLGEKLDITVMDGSVMVDDAQVILTDIETSNGVIHVIDSVLQPSS